MIEVRGLSKRYDQALAVAGIDFTARPGEVLALLGPNGAGKSTTIKAITGLLRPTSGSIRLAGFDVVRDDVAAKAQLGYVPDRPYLYGKLSGRELLYFVSRIRKLDDPGPRIAAGLERFGLADAADRLVETYSHGMRQKLTFLAATLHDPAVLVIDEPMVGLDPRAARQIKDLMTDGARRGKTVLLTTHSMDVAQEVADRVLVMHRGRIAAEGTMGELRAHIGARLGSDHADLEAIFLQLTAEEHDEASAPTTPPEAPIGR